MQNGIIYIYDFIWQSNSKSRVYPRARILMFRKLVQNGFWDTPFAPGRLPVSRAGIQSLHRTPHLWGEGRYGWGAFFGDHGEIMGKIHQWRSLTGSGYSIQWVSNGYIYLVGVQRRYHAETRRVWFVFVPESENWEHPPHKRYDNFLSWLNHIPQYPIKSMIAMIVGDILVLQSQNIVGSLLSPVPSTGWKASNFAYQNGHKSCWTRGNFRPQLWYPLEISHSHGTWPMKVDYLPLKNGGFPVCKLLDY